MLGWLALAAVNRPALAQTQAPDPWEQGRVRIGPLAFTPAVTLTNLGWDTNVFNEVENPKEDFTIAATGLVNWWFRTGNLRMIGTESVDGLYYATYASERGISYRHDLRVEYRLNRLIPYTQGSYASIKDRPGYEIDARARHTLTAFGAGLDVRFGGKTHLDLAGRKTTSAFAGDEVFDGSSLAETFNRKGTYGSLTFRYDATKLTTLTLLGEAGRERFDESPVRDNDSFRIMPGVKLDPFALVKGTASVGYRRFDAISPTIPDFEGVVAAVELSYVLLGRTRFAVSVDRDIQFSYEVDQPYYLFTGVRGSVRQGLGMGWDIEARGSTQHLAYRQTIGASASTAGRVDRVQSYGGGIGFRLRGGMRLGVNADYTRRLSDYGRGYEGIRYGLSAAYGF